MKSCGLSWCSTSSSSSNPSKGDSCKNYPLQKQLQKSNSFDLSGGFLKQYPQPQLKQGPRMNTLLRLNSVGETSPAISRFDQYSVPLHSSTPISIQSRSSCRLLPVGNKIIKSPTFGLQSSGNSFGLGLLHKKLNLSSSMDSLILKKPELASFAPRSRSISEEHQKLISGFEEDNYKSSKPDANVDLDLPAQVENKQTDLCNILTKSQPNCFFNINMKPDCESKDVTGNQNYGNSDVLSFSSMLSAVKDSCNCDVTSEGHASKCVVKDQEICDDTRHENSVTPNRSFDKKMNHRDSSVESCSVIKNEEKCPSVCGSNRLSDLTAVLFDRKGGAKRGRPTSKKQKKRQREKLKLSTISTNDESGACRSDTKSNSCLSYKVSNCDQSVNDHHPTSECLEDESSSFMSVGNETLEDSFGENSSSLLSKQYQGNPSTSDHFSMQCEARLSNFTYCSSDTASESEGEVSGSEDDWHDNEAFCADNNSLLNGIGFNIALSLDSIFKKNCVPSLKSVMNECTDVHVCPSASSSPVSTPYSQQNRPSRSIAVCITSPNDSLEDSIEFSSPPHSLENQFDFYKGLCLDGIIGISNQTSVCLPIEESEDSLTDGEAHSNLSLPSNEDIQEINSKWNENYPSAGFRSCSNDSNSVIINPTIQVRFVEEPLLTTVHIVGTEERRGIWYTYAVDRERFDRRIQELENTLSPIFEQDHRARIYKRNIDLEAKRL